MFGVSIIKLGYYMHRSHIHAVLGFVFLGILSRLIPHPPNFNAISALALLGTYSLGNVWLSLSTVFTTMFLSDIIFGFHSCLPFVYLSCGLIACLGHWVSSTETIAHRLFLLVASALIFF